jgi:hypothetical protein
MWPTLPGRNTLIPFLWLALLFSMGNAGRLYAQIATTTIEDTVYNADGSVATGTLLVSWPSFSTAANGTVTAGSVTATIGADGFVSLNLTPNTGATPAGTYYTAVYHLQNAAGNSTVSKEYWLVPAVTQATIAGIRTLVVPAAVAMSTASKQYVDSSVAALSQTYVQLAGGSMTGPLLLSTDPTGAAQASTKHYVDTQISTVSGLIGSGTDPNAIHANTANPQSVEGPFGALSLNAPIVNHVLYADQFTTVQAAVTAACAASPVGMVVIPNTVAVPATGPEFSNPCAAVVLDERVAHEDVFDPRAYGAVCNGAGDDTVPLQATINAASAAVQSGGRLSAQVQMPNAECRGNVTLYSGVSLNGHYGARGGSSQLGGTHPGQPVITVAAGAGNIGIHDLSIFGQGQSLVVGAIAISRVSGVVTVTSSSAIPTVVGVGAPVVIGGVGPDLSFNGIYSVASVSSVTVGATTTNGTTFTYSQTAGLGQCARKSNVVTCTSSAPLPNNGYTAFSTGTNVTVNGAADSTYNGTFAVTAIGGDLAGGTSYPTTFSYADSGANGSTTGGTAYPANFSVVPGLATDLGGGSGTIVSAVRSANTLALTIAGPPIYAWGGPGAQLTISGASDSTINGTWLVNGYTPGANLITVANTGTNETVAAGSVSNLMDKGIWIPNAVQVHIERVTGVNFGDGLLDWEGGEVLFINHVEATNCLQDVSKKTVRQLPLYPPAGGLIPPVSPMGCVVMNGTDGYMEFSEISTGSVSIAGSAISVVDATLPSKAIVNGWNGINNWYVSNIGELSDEGIWSGGQFNRWSMNRADLNAGTGIEDQSNSSIWVGNMALHDDSDQVVAPGTWNGINETGGGQNSLGGNVWTGNSVIDNSPTVADINDGRTSGSGTPNVWSGNFAQSYSTPAGYSSSFEFLDNDFKYSPNAYTGVLGGNVAGLHNVLLQGSSSGQQIGNFTGGVPGQRIRVMSYDGNTTLVPGNGYALHTCSGYPFTPQAGQGVTDFTLLGDYAMTWQMDCPQVSPWQLDGHGSLNMLQTPNPTQAAQAYPTGTAGTSNYSYVCTQVNLQGLETLPTPTGSTTTGNGTLGTANNNTVYCPQVAGVGLQYQKVYRTVVPAGSSLAVGYIGNTTLVGYTGMTDSGQAVVNATAPPVVNHTADISTQGSLSIGGGAAVLNSSSLVQTNQTNTFASLQGFTGGLSIGAGPTLTNSANVAQVNQANTFASAQTFTAGISLGIAGQALIDGSGDITASGISKLANVVEGGPRVDVRYYGAVGDGVTDNCTALTNAASAVGNGAAGGVLYVPALVFDTTCAVNLPVNGSLYIEPGGILQAKTGSTMAAVVVAGATGFWADQLITGGGTLDANNVATRALWLKRQTRGRITNLRMLNAAGAACVQNGDTADGYTGSNSLDAFEFWCYRTSGAIVAGSYGIWDDNATDSKWVQGYVKGYATGIRDDVGGSRYAFVHVWDTNASGSMTTCFDDNSQGNWWDNNVCDTPTTYGAVLRQYNSHWNNNRFELSNTYGVTNTAIAFHSVNADPTSFFSGNEFTAATPNGTMTWAKDFDITPVANMQSEFVENRSTEVTTNNVGTNDYFRSTNSFGSYKDFGSHTMGSANVVSGTNTPTFLLKNDNVQKFTLSGNVTSGTYTSSGALQIWLQEICQNTTGGYSYNWAGTGAPIGGGVPGLTASSCSVQQFYDDGTTKRALGPMMTSDGLNMSMPGKATVGEIIAPIFATGNAGNTDFAGQLALASGTATYTFYDTAHTVSPICIATDTTATNAVRCSATATVLTVYGTGSDVLNYQLIFRDSN